MSKKRVSMRKLITLVALTIIIGLISWYVDIRSAELVKDFRFDSFHLIELVSRTFILECIVLTLTYVRVDSFLKYIKQNNRQLFVQIICLLIAVITLQYFSVTLNLFKQLGVFLLSNKIVTDFLIITLSFWYLTVFEGN